MCDLAHVAIKAIVARHPGASRADVVAAVEAACRTHAAFPPRASQRKLAHQAVAQFRALVSPATHAREGCVAATGAAALHARLPSLAACVAAASPACPRVFHALAVLFLFGDIFPP
jgi:hypothetical protein